MGTHKVITSDAEIDQAIQRGRILDDEPRVTEVEYLAGPRLELLILKLSDGTRHVIPRENLEGLQGATSEQIAAVEVLGNGTGLHWPQLDIDYYMPNLLRHIYGTMRWMAEIGRRGGTAKSVAKRRASQANGLKGGRPKQNKQLVSRA
jgi:hypothetical protein